ncbi:PD-(D/E)XK nuclease family protein [Candidatus Cyanaurora vandensis]|uniref:PD-(D/E)XK nuclease family protein n=1 Tax=Candidatus Cyanaurora vandensis TaxID=2714958 RepID=UPI0025799EBD|nr:PD-(D/E)XK nuclease family protein [Candidatus Cyanaurora vandensis]
MEPEAPRPKGRHYQVEGQAYPGVSTILRETQNPEKLRRLAQWRERVGAAEAQRITQEATSRGTLLHKLTETHLKSEDVAAALARATPEQAALVSSFWEKTQTVLPLLEEPFLIESVVWHRIGHYAGVVDLACYWGAEDGRYPVVLDWKTSSKPKQLAWVEDYILQMTAYASAINRMYDTRIQQGVLVIASPDLLQVFPLDLRPYWGTWLKRLYRYWHRHPDHPLADQAITALNERYRGG